MLLLMKARVALLTMFLALPSFAFADQPQGQVIEVHAVEVYTGGCTASAQATSGGRSMLRVWNFEAGNHNGIDLRGQQIAALQTADKNLADSETRPKAAVVYVPRSASEAQRKAMLDWLKTAMPEFVELPLITKVTDLRYAQNGARITVDVGDQIAMKTREIQKCDAGACGEALWYQPRSKVSDYTVVVNESSTVSEPDLSLVWKDNSAKSVFVGQFGSEAKPQFRLASVE